MELSGSNIKKIPETETLKKCDIFPEIEFSYISTNGNNFLYFGTNFLSSINKKTHS